jgi:hypothetical protein
MKKELKIAVPKGYLFEPCIKTLKAGIENLLYTLKKIPYSM